MSLTSSQAAALKASASSDATVTSFIARSDWFSVALNYNGPTTTKVWRPDFTITEMVNGSVLGPGIDWTEYAAINSDQKQQYLSLTQSDTLDLTKGNVRIAIGQVFPAVSSASAVAAPSTRANLLNISARFGTKYETLSSFTVSAGANSVTSVYGYVLQPGDVQQAMTS